jgi:hypothetical protein
VPRPFLNLPANSFFLMSTDTTGCPRLWAAMTIAVDVLELRVPVGMSRPFIRLAVALTGAKTLQGASSVQQKAKVLSKLPTFNHAWKQTKHAPEIRRRDQVVDAARAGDELDALSGGELDPAEAAVSITAAQEVKRLQRLIFGESVEAQCVVASSMLPAEVSVRGR